MKFHNNLKEGLYRFLHRIVDEKNFPEIINRVSRLKDYPDFKSYFSDVVKSIQPLGPETDREIRSKYSYIRSNLAIVAGLYYVDNLSLKHIKRDYPEEITTHSLDDEALRREVTTFTRHLLFGKEVSGIDAVGELQIEQEGLVPMMNRIMAEVEGDAAQKNELMKHFRVYQHLSERSLKEAAEAAKHDPHLTLLRNTLANSGEARSSVAAQIITGQDTEEDNTKESDTREISFVEKYASNKKTGGKKSVSFPDL